MAGLKRESPSPSTQFDGQFPKRFKVVSATGSRGRGGGHRRPPCSNHRGRAFTSVRRKESRGQSARIQKVYCNRRIPPKGVSFPLPATLPSANVQGTFRNYPRPQPLTPSRPSEWLSFTSMITTPDHSKIIVLSCWVAGCWWWDRSLMRSPVTNVVCSLLNLG